MIGPRRDCGASFSGNDRSRHTSHSGSQGSCAYVTWTAGGIVNPALQRLMFV